MATQSWGWIADQFGNSLSGRAIQIKNLDGTPATHWDAVVGGTSSTVDLLTSGDGTIPRFIEEGSYTFVVPSVFSRRVEAVSAGGGAYIPDFLANTFYRVNTVVRDSNGVIQRANNDFTSGASFNQSNWTQLPLPGEAISVAGGIRGEVVPQMDPGVWGPGTRVLNQPGGGGRTYLMRFSPKRAWNITLAAWDVTAFANTDDNVEVAFYSADLTTRLSTSGITAGKLNVSNGIKSVAITQATDPALVYYVAFKAPITLLGTGATVNARTCSGVANTLFGTTVPTALAGFIDLTAGAALPTSITAASVNWTAINTFPLIALREV